MKYLIAFLVVVLAFAKASSQEVIGTWKTIDDVTGIVKSHVEIYKRDGKIYGKVAQILDRNAPANPLCKNCDGAFKNAPILGLEIIQGLEKKGGVYKGGDILDPENGKTYTCKIWLNEKDANQLMVRGYVAFFYRTQTWKRL
ncbi:DUF2147 domain-containing protein [Nonlabens sp. MB-3u-79]|uniref:DUF2147 domain-containing protein n=1 Tax=Nonlabens sp. MB-3u-79 TaxID=2058134 RepID=UPI000C30B4C9|nr:DUF2147 domain-containing protein [Nonlabens sp. MB-3u-79]AUC80103.1 DUF2147 domain-containing protein [Nonlabens sp. MB-3u-79]